MHLVVRLAALLCFGEAYAFAPPDAMEFTYKENKYPGVTEFRIVYATGAIVAGAAEKFRLFVNGKGIKGGAVVLFNSNGGSVAEALSMGRMIRRMGFDTDVQSSCFSSCTLAFLGGVRRTVGADAKFGVHRISSNTQLGSADALDLGQIAISQIVEYATFMGVESAFVSELTKAGPDKINLLSQDQLRKFKIVTSEFMTNWEIKAAEGHFYLVAATKTNNGYHKMLFTCDPTTKKVDIIMLYNATGEYKDSVLKIDNHLHAGY